MRLSELAGSERKEVTVPQIEVSEQQILDSLDRLSPKGRRATVLRPVACHRMLKCGQGRTLDQLEYQRRNPVGFLKAVNRSDVGMMERRPSRRASRSNAARSQWDENFVLAELEPGLSLASATCALWFYVWSCDRLSLNLRSFRSAPTSPFTGPRRTT